MTEKNLAQRAGHLELLEGGKKDRYKKDAAAAKGAAAKGGVAKGAAAKGKK
jgi:hypothetical protein